MLHKEISRRRGVPIFTFMNKMDRPALEPLALLDELEHVLDIAAFPMNWPLGAGLDFKGVWDRRLRLAYLYERTPGGAYRAPVSIAGLSDPIVRDRLGEETCNAVREEIEMLDGAGSGFHPDDVLAGKTTPVYFGSALNNFGVQLMLDGFLDYSCAPTPRRSRKGVMIGPAHKAFSGFVFKIQANMDPRHRDRVAFVRVVSGKFERNMQVTNARTGNSIRMAGATKIFGRDRETIDDAYPGDVLGISRGQRVLLFTDDWSMRYFHENNPDTAISPLPFSGPAPKADAQPRRRKTRTMESPDPSNGESDAGKTPG